MSTVTNEHSNTVIRNPRFLGVFLRVVCASALTYEAVRAEAIKYAKPEFTQTNRAQDVIAVLPEVDKAFEEFAQTEHIPGLVYGVVLDGKLIHSQALGFANLERKTP